jgi:molybdate transport system substrate-binding protein
MRSRLQYILVSLVALIGLACVSFGGAVEGARAGSRSADSGTLTVYAAASLTAAFTTIGQAFGKANNVTVKFSFGGSDTLATQIVQGAPADVFASANQTQMNVVAQKSLVAGTPTVFARNRLVVIVPKNNPANIAFLPDLGRPGVKLVLADPTVPVGKYARAAFTVMASDDTFGPDFLARIEKNTVSNETDVKAVVSKVSLGEADAGVVYTTDVTPQVAKQVQTIAIPQPFNQIATYPIAALKASQNAAMAQKFVTYVLSPAGQAVLAQQGFLPPTATGAFSPSFTVSGLVQTPMTFTVADLQKLPVTTVTVTLRTDKGSQGVLSYTGVLLNTVIQQTVPITNTGNKNDILRLFATVGATDGYQTTVSMAEILPQFGNQKVLLAYKEDGKLLSQAEGAVRLIVPGDYLAGRWVSNVNSVVVGTPTGTS